MLNDELRRRRDFDYFASPSLQRAVARLQTRREGRRNNSEGSFRAEPGNQPAAAGGARNPNYASAVAALRTLGCKRKEAENLVREAVEQGYETISDLVREAMKLRTA